MKAITKEAFQASVLAQIPNKDAGWGQAQSLAVAKAMFKECTGEDMPADLASCIGNIINPSAFRQVLEKQKLLNERAPKNERIDKAFLKF